LRNRARSASKRALISDSLEILTRFVAINSSGVLKSVQEICF
jgi:hypothetical protein